MTVRFGLTTDIDVCFDLRRAVFIDEQGIPEAEEIDAYDADALHILASAGATPIGCARVVIFGTTAKIGRVCVVQAHRGQAVGIGLIAACEDVARMRGVTRAILGAQIAAVPFYERLGYFRFGDVFDDAGLPHVMMERGL